MKGKLMFVAGVTAGFVVGARGGREAYIAMKARAQTVSQSPTVQNAVGRAKDLAEAKAPKIAGTVFGAASAAQGAAEAAHDAGVAADDQSPAAA